MNDKEIKLSRNGRLIVVSDLHGNYNDYEKYIELWDKDDPNNHIVFIGDLIHSPFSYDRSVELLDDAIEKSMKYPNFHILLGNHEWAHITKENIFKANRNQRLDFEKQIEIKKGCLQPSLNKYVKFFKSLAYFIKTDNGLFISHTGPSTKVKTIKDYEKIFDNDYNNLTLYDFLWNRPVVDYKEYDVDNFLKIIDKNAMIVGHSNVDGFKKFSNQIIIASSFLTDNKVYFDIDLKKDITDVNDLMDYMKFLE